ncbi:hypothetical protein XAP412_100026 [Xanthomonas phaseoli pv. phaseoli]|uniref:Uncharacterized protein n=1 Tax=Xanthomonas campestris pv. phaseoli TaxID=317013 RepID=A0AB38DUN9_XANCH|nr:hypothetical protein XAP412_100026 [Xanthomonas phaseoli pv. phaseoli]SON76416.1 hypothetical protein XAP7430_100012 [Xanthomonas phaseoli pv. phaseoli]SON77774.1 hypothetical protein XAP6984_140033 [Xanthomonas phaseoli pv. phaseoli]SOO29916.1 hypothetical protein XAP6164_380002 [Xanthomonas phaseoli pv. phaseoli]
MDDAIMTRIYGYHGNRTTDIYNSARFPERRYAVIGVYGYNRRLEGGLARVDNTHPCSYGPSADYWVDERDRDSDEQELDDDYRDTSFFAGATTSAATRECWPASGVERQVRPTEGTSASHPSAAGAVRPGLPPVVCAVGSPIGCRVRPDRGSYASTTVALPAYQQHTRGRQPVYE